IVIVVQALVVIIVAMILVIRRNKRKNRDPEAIQLTEMQHLQPRLSRHASENSLLEGYDDHGTNSSNTSSTNSVSNSATPSTINKTYQMRGSTHDSENDYIWDCN
ncbi:unnamed protein product, partial [Meganyctiphanes norvegica]